MIYWNTNKLAEQIKINSACEKEKKNYYMAVSVLVTIFMYMAIGGGTSDGFATLVECVLLIIILVFGINITFNTNKGGDGEDYIARVTILSLPLLIKIFIFSFVAGILYASMIGITENNGIDLGQWPAVSISVAAQILYFWRINVHLNYINT